MENIKEEMAENILDFSVVQKGCVLYSFLTNEYFLATNKSPKTCQLQKLKLCNNMVGEQKKYYFQKKNIANQINNRDINIVTDTRKNYTYKNSCFIVNQNLIDNQILVCEREIAVVNRMEKAIHEFKQKETQKILSETPKAKQPDNVVSEEPAEKMYWFMPGDLITYFNSGTQKNLTPINFYTFDNTFSDFFKEGSLNLVLRVGMVTQNALYTNPKFSFFRLENFEIFMCYKTINEVWNPEIAGCKILKYNKFDNFQDIKQEYNKEPSKTTCWMTVDEYLEKRKKIFEQEKDKWVQISELVSKLMKKTEEKLLTPT